MKVWGAGIGKAYLEVAKKGKIYIVAGPESETMMTHPFDKQSPTWSEELRFKMVT